MAHTSKHKFQDVLHHPELDEPRLLYASAIEKKDPERAQFIRVQLRLKSPEFQSLSFGERHKVEQE